MNNAKIYILKIINNGYQIIYNKKIYIKECNPPLIRTVYNYNVECSYNLILLRFDHYIHSTEE